MAARKPRKTRRHTTKRHTRRHASVKAELGHVIKTLQKIKKAA